MSNDATRKAAALRKVAEALLAWGKFQGANSPEALEATRTALDLATRHFDIITDASNRWGCHGGAARALDKLSEITAERGRKDFGKYSGWWGAFTQPQLCGSPVPVGFPDELERWADEFDKAGAVAAPRHEAADVHASGGKTAGGRKAPAVTPTTVSDDAKMSVAELSKAFGVPAEALRKRLERLRRRDLTCFAEVPEHARQQPTFLYHVGKVRAVIEALKASVKASAKRPT
ncbi:MAG: hypothetical protein NTY65_06180 [Planctomycetota bacterium]|nr:hypothetical protein [Planctomycetota bacterium]